MSRNDTFRTKSLIASAIDSSLLFPGCGKPGASYRKRGHVGSLLTTMERQQEQEIPSLLIA